jgi:hypothetical protein
VSISSPLDQKPVHFQGILALKPDRTPSSRGSLFPREVARGM